LWWEKNGKRKFFDIMPSVRNAGHGRSNVAVFGREGGDYIGQNLVDVSKRCRALSYLAGI